MQMLDISDFTHRYPIFDRYINYIISLLQHSIQGYNLPTTTRLDKKSFSDIRFSTWCYISDPLPTVSLPQKLSADNNQYAWRAKFQLCILTPLQISD
jgi:hypothetical protein